MKLSGLIFVGIAAILGTKTWGHDEPTIVSCKFENLPLMQFIFRGTSADESSTVQIGEREPLFLSIGSSTMSAHDEKRGTNYRFFLGTPPNVDVRSLGASNDVNFYGDCISSLN